MTTSESSSKQTTILRAESIAAWREGERFLERAMHDAATLKKQAQEDAVKARTSGWQAGFDEGRQAGLQEAAQLALEITAERDAYLNGLTAQLAHALDVSIRQILDGLDHAELIAAVVRKAIQDMQAHNTIALRVPPATVAALEQQGLRFNGQAVPICADNSLHGAMCYLDTPLGTVELTAQTQWGRIFDSVSQTVGAPDGD